MSDAASQAQAQVFLEYLKALPFCRQENDSLVAVHKLTSEVIEAIREHEVKLYPGGMVVKLPRSVLMGLQKHSDEDQPLPAVIVWKKEGVEIWFRRQKSTDFPYDTWTDPAAVAMERERAFIGAEHFSADFAEQHAAQKEKSQACPSMIPPY